MRLLLVIGLSFKLIPDLILHHLICVLESVWMGPDVVTVYYVVLCEWSVSISALLLCIILFPSNGQSNHCLVVISVCYPLLKGKSAWKWNEMISIS